MSREPAALLKLPRAVLPAFVTVAVLGSLLLVGRALQPTLDQPLSSVRVDGTLVKLDATRVVEAAQLSSGARLFELDLDAIRDRVEALPWVAHARISRVWPDRLAIVVQERQPYARWGEAALIDRDSHIFTPVASDIDPALPQLNAPEGHEAEVAATFEALRGALAGSPFVPSGLSLDARGEWKLATARGIELRLGQGDPQQHLALIEGAVATTLATELDRIAYVDLRYANGFAVGYRDGTDAKKPAAPSGARAAQERKR
jgi:cell division protein FtsQ